MSAVTDELSYDEVEHIIERTEPATLSDRGDTIWTRRMAVALADLFNTRLRAALSLAEKGEEPVLYIRPDVISSTLLYPIQEYDMASRTRNEEKGCTVALFAARPAPRDDLVAEVERLREALEQSTSFIESITQDPLLMGDDIEMTLGDVQSHARIELQSIRKKLKACAEMDDASVAARFHRLHRICSGILWSGYGSPAMDHPKTQAALRELSEYLFAAGVDAALSEGRS